MSGASQLKSYAGCRMPVVVFQKLGAEVDVRQGCCRTAPDTSADSGRTEVVGFDTVVLCLRRSSTPVDDLIYRQPSIVLS